MSKKLFRSHDDDDDEEDDDAAQTNKSLPRANFYASRWFRFPEDHEQCDQIG